MIRPLAQGLHHGRLQGPAGIRVMFIMLSKKPRKTNRTKTKRFRAKLKAKNTARRKRLFAWKSR